MALKIAQGERAKVGSQQILNQSTQKERYRLASKRLIAIDKITFSQLSQLITDSIIY